jgi:hypothetical protein
VVSPTTHLGVSVVVANQGAADEPHVAIDVTLTDQASGEARTQRVSTPLTLGASVTLPTVTFAVQPGSGYVLTVSLVLPPGQTLTLGTSTQKVLRVAPAS